MADPYRGLDRAQIEAARAQWTHRGQSRPAFAEEPSADQRSVWDFPRPPALEPVSAVLELRLGATEIARTERGLAVLETGHPPTYYFPRGDVDGALLTRAPGHSVCEWKGRASYFDVAGVARAAWTYAEPFDEFAPLEGHLAFMPHGFECLVDGERARPQGGGFYGGWITRAYAGPFRGD